MFLLDVMNTCHNATLATVLSITKRVLLLIQIIVPILLIVYASYGMYQLLKDPDKKNGTKEILNKFLAAAIIFFIPMFLDVVMGMVGENTNFSSCWKNASSSGNSRSSYINIHDEDHSKSNKSNILNDSDSYEQGTKSEDSSSSVVDTSTPTSNANKVIFLGDSRTVQMYAYLTGDWSGANYSSGGVHVVEDDVFVAQGSMGLDWMQNTGIPAAKTYFGKGSALVILMGVNDIYNADNYIRYLNSNVSSWTSTGTKVYFVSVNPCDGSYNSMNPNISSFNSKLHNNLPSGVGWIDTYSYLTSSGFSTSDGLHYTQNTSNQIYNYIKSRV